MTEPRINWADELGSKLSKEVTITVSGIFNQTHKVCLTCNRTFSYERTDEDERFLRQFSLLKKGDLSVCCNCDELDEKLAGSKSFVKK